MKRNEKCQECEVITDNFYKINLNKSIIYRCRDCYEKVFQRNQREQYGSNSKQEQIYMLKDEND